MFPNNDDFDMKISLESEGNALPEDMPFRILVLSDWSGRENNKHQQNQTFTKSIEIDRDNFDEVLERMNVKLNLQFSSDETQSLSFEFRELDDFHPDKIFESQPLFSELRNLRRQLTDSKTFNSAAREVRSWFEGNIDEDNAQSENNIDQPSEKQQKSENLLAQILEGNTDVSESQKSSQIVESTSLRSFVKNITKTHIVQIDSEEQSKLLLIVDEVISDLMRNILHHPDFQALEASWRGLFLFVRRVETDSSLKIYIYDISKSELSDNLKSVSDLNESDFANILRKNTFDDANISPWAVVLGNFDFNIDVSDIAALMRVGKISNSYDAPFVSKIKPALFGLDSFDNFEHSNALRVSEESNEAKLWNMLCSAPESTHISLALQKVLGRMPYGNKTEPTERFFFEEFLDKVEHKNFLWINPVFYVGIGLAETFQKNEWYIRANLNSEIDNLPVYLYQFNGEAVTKPCSEILLTQNNLTKLTEYGFTPLISYKNSDSVRITNLPSISNPLFFLKGKWK